MLIKLIAYLIWIVQFKDVYPLLVALGTSVSGGGGVRVSQGRANFPLPSERQL